MDQPKWLEEAWRELGQRELPGRAHNARVLELYRDAGHPEVRNDETAWCAAFVGACLKRAGHAGSGSLMARSYLHWGRKLDKIRVGAIAVFSRGADPASGHVGFVAEDGGNEIVLLGGNQGDAVSVATFPRSRLLGLRWPDDGARNSSGPAIADDERLIFDQALGHVLAMEGGYTDDPYDPGGPSNKGITLRVFAEWSHVTVDAGSFASLKDELKRIPDSVVADIYRARYWRPAACAELAPAIALMHFDASVNHGVGTANRMLQHAVQVAEDGEVGPATLTAVRRADQSGLLERYAALRRERYRSLAHFWRFGRGWIARVDHTLTAAKKLQTMHSHPEKGLSPMPISPSLSTSSNAPASGGTQPLPKWWGESMTVWGAVVTALAAVLPALASIGGITLTPDLIHQAGSHMAEAVQSLIALVGTVITIYGRVKAHRPLERREISLKV